MDFNSLEIFVNFDRITILIIESAGADMDKELQKSEIQNQKIQCLEIQCWIEKIQKKSDPVAQNDLITYYYKDIYAYVFKKTLEKELAMDLTQEIFMNMLKTIHQFDEKVATFRTWLYQIARHRIIDYYRSKGHRQQELQHLLEDDAHQTSDFLNTLLNRIQIEEIEQFINSLTEDRQVIFWLKIVEQKSFSEIAQRLKAPESTIKTRFYATLKLVQNEFERRHCYE